MERLKWAHYPFERPVVAVHHILPDGRRENYISQHGEHE